ncbi:hypothetical protein Pfra02_37510 [Pseudomonas fragi]|nr:hypothetical protein Pfra02_37510 [Pseudomonas fragi]
MSTIIHSEQIRAYKTILTKMKDLTYMHKCDKSEIHAIYPTNNLLPQKTVQICRTSDTQSATQNLITR